MAKTSQTRPKGKPKPRIGLAAIFKNEAPYVVEWLAHHRLIGIDHFFIADNNSTDETRDILQQLSKTGLVRWMPWPDVSDSKPQIPAYRNMLAKFGNCVDWIAHLDADEYLWKTADDDLVDFLYSMPEDVGAIAFNWAAYGSSDHYVHVPASTPERFIWHAGIDNPVSHNFKSIARPSAILDFTCPHNVTLRPSYRYIHPNKRPKESLNTAHQNPEYAHCQSRDVHWDHFRINHYIIRSWEEYATKKSRRGRAYSRSPLDELYFWGHDFHEVPSHPGQAYAERLQQEITQINKLLDPATLLTVGATFSNRNIPPPPILGNIESVKMTNDITIIGWALEWTRYRIKKVDIIINKHQRITDFEMSLVPRPDVLTHHKGADLLCGFFITIKNKPLDSINSIEIRGISPENWTTKPLIWKSPTEYNVPFQNSIQPDR